MRDRVETCEVRVETPVCAYTEDCFGRKSPERQKEQQQLELGKERRVHLHKTFMTVSVPPGVNGT